MSLAHTRSLGSRRGRHPSRGGEACACAEDGVHTHFRSNVGLPAVPSGLARRLGEVPTGSVSLRYRAVGMHHIGKVTQEWGLHLTGHKATAAGSPLGVLVQRLIICEWTPLPGTQRTAQSGVSDQMVGVKRCLRLAKCTPALQRLLATKSHCEEVGIGKRESEARLFQLDGSKIAFGALGSDAFGQPP